MVFRKPTHLRCSALQCVAVCCSVLLSVHYTASTLQHTATHCNTLQLTLQRTQPHTANRLTYLTVSDRWRPGVYPAIVSKSNTLQCTLQHTLQHKLQHTVFNIPNCPRSLAPQEYTRPLSARATVCLFPALTAARCIPSATALQLIATNTAIHCNNLQYIRVASAATL